MIRYYLQADGYPEREVMKAEFVARERACGFHNTLGEPDEPATGGFSAGGWCGRTYGEPYAQGSP